MEERIREMIMEALAQYFEVEPDEDGKHNINSYEWEAGCYMGVRGKWFSLKEVVFCMEDFIQDELIYELEDLLDED